MVSNEQFTYDELAAPEVDPVPVSDIDPGQAFSDSQPSKRRMSKKDLQTLGAIGAAFLVVCLVFLLFSSPGGERTFPVYISEILASNTCYPNGDGRCCDYIELHNSADYTVDLSGFQLGDVAGSSRYRFPAGTTIEPGAYLVVYCDKTIDDESYAKFGISRGGGEDFYLIGTSNAIVDKVTTIPTDLDESMVLYEGQWITSSTVTPGRGHADIQAGQVLYNADVSPVQITELSSAKTGFSEEFGVHCDWVELYNSGSEPADISGYRLTDNIGVDKYIFPAGTVLAPGQYLIVLCTDEVRNDILAPFGLSQPGGESVVLKNEGGMIVEIVDCLPMNSDESLALTAGNTWAVTKECTPGFENSTAGHQAYLSSIGLDSKSIVISEVMAASQALLPDCYGDFSDWIELANTGDRAVNLSGWYLSDNPADPDKWEFPSLVLQPGQRMVIFCSGRDTVQDGQIHTGFSLSSGGESLVLRSYQGYTVDSVTFGESGANCSFVFSDAEAILTERPTPGYSNDSAGYEQFCAANVPTGHLAIWEVMTANDWYLPQDLGVCYDWVELRNISGQTIQLSDYAITDDPDAPVMYVLPDRELQPGASIVIILSGDESLSNNRYSHAGFSLNAKEDQLLLYAIDGTLADYVFLKEVPLGYSYGRSEQTGGFFYMEPTPENANKPGIRQVSAMPTSDIAPGVYTGKTGFTVPFSAVGDIYYTTDGSDPDVTSMKYENPIRIEETTVLRAAAVEDGKLRSEIYTATFIMDSPHSIPVVSLVTDPDNLWGKNGIYKSGDITVKEEKRAANVSYTGSDGSFSINCELSLHGNSTVTRHDKKSFSLSFKDSYDGALQYDLFEDAEVTAFDTLALRTAVEDKNTTQIRDNLFHYLAYTYSDSLPCQKYKYVALYLNGEYWGLYSIREKHSATHYASYANVPVSSVTVIKAFIKPSTALHPILQQCERKSFKADADYEYAKSVLDVNSFADWMILESYASNVDIADNMRYYYSEADGLWRCGLVDLDYACMYSTSGFERVANEFNHGVIVSALMENEDFQELLATRLAQLLSGPMSDQQMLNTIDMLADSIRDEIPLERERWGGTVKEWETELIRLKNYCDGRAVEMIDSLCRCFNFTKEERAHYFSEVLALHGAA